MSNEVLDNLKISVEFRDRLSDLVFDSQQKKSELARAIGISPAIIIRALSVGLIPSTSSLIKMANYFAASIDYLTGFTDNDTFIKSENSTTFYERIKELKEIKNISEFEIANKVGFPRSLFSRWKENRYTPSFEIAVSLAQFFKVSLDYLLGRTDENRFQ